ncbi:MAG: acyl transferase [Crocinitomicaceae bacterium]
MNDLIHQIFSIEGEAAFERAALEVFRYQFNNVQIYQSYCQSIGVTNPKTLSEIPFLPIEFFKTHDILVKDTRTELTFKSSGTGGDRSKHHIADPSVYERSFMSFYNESIGDPTTQVILALLPSYLEQGESSLVYMVNQLMKETNDNRSSFILSDIAKLDELYAGAIKDHKEPVLFGVSYALLDLCELAKKYPKLKIIETGGMKGRRKEMTKNELHSILNEKLEPAMLCSEYGMTELLSQAYSNGPTNFHAPKWMKVLVREIDDPFSYESFGKTGGINIIDLANIYSCSFIATQDLGKVYEDGTFDVLGRFDHSDIRGCNLLVQ